MTVILHAILRKEAIATYCLFICSLCTSLATAQERVKQDLVALYDFAERSGIVVHDRSGNEPPIDLSIDNPASTAWRGGALVVHTGALISSAAAPDRIIESIKSSGAVTIEAWVKPHTSVQAGPARIVSISADTSQRNFTLGQDGQRFDVRLRTTATDNNGLPSMPSAPEAANTEITHIVYVRNAQGIAKLYRNGQLSSSGTVSGDFSNWNSDFRLLLANEATQDRPWLGELHLVAIYNRALNESEIAQNFAAGHSTGPDYAAQLPPAVERTVDFVTDVQPILRQRCFECHAQGNEEGGLNLSVRARVMEGGAGGPVLTRGDSAGSRVIHLVAGVEDNAIMPPEGERLTAQQIGILRAWIDQGAAWPAGADVLDPRLERAREHWAFQPLRSPALPAMPNSEWVQSPIDTFLLAGMEANGLQPTERAAAATLVRRMYFDMIGLPPAPSEAERFTAALQHDWHSGVLALADHLLSSHHYGERWGRHWLDVARYADSAGQEGDQDRPHAYHYRDFVIRALNEDMPFNTFVRWQLAGDEYEPLNPRAVAATGFLTAGPNTVLENTFLEAERLRNRYNELDDMLSTIGSGMLGITLGCARCHDHKYDAVSAREYYRLMAALHSGDRKELQHESGVELLAFQDFESQPRPTWLFERADFYDRDQMVQLGFLEVLSRGKTAEDYWSESRAQNTRSASTFQRRALAEWITDVKHGAGALLARVIVNRVWQHHFGEGLVRTVSDFGVRGDTPSHPELLEWLAADLVAHGWQLKRLHRLILTSAAYQQAARLDLAQSQIDPENRWLWRMRPQRLEAEIVRDSILAVSGVLNKEAYGPAFKPPIAAEAKIARNLKSPYPDDVADGPATWRRSIYMFHKRVIPYPLLQAFDRPDSLQSCGRRETTTVAPQALALLNDAFVRARALDFADALLRSYSDDRPALVQHAFQTAFGRQPKDFELNASLSLIQTQLERRQMRDGNISLEVHQRSAVADFCQSLFALNEFIYVD